MLSLYSCCSVLLQLICAVLMQATFQIYHHYKIRDLSLPCSCVLCRVLRWINTYYLCAVCRVRAWQCSAMYGYCLSVDISVLCFQSFMFWYAHSGYNVITYGTIKIVLCYCVLIQQADFLLVNIYTRCKRLRNKELRVGISVGVADLALFNA